MSAILERSQGSSRLAPAVTPPLLGDPVLYYSNIAKGGQDEEIRINGSNFRTWIYDA